MRTRTERIKASEARAVMIDRTFCAGIAGRHICDLRPYLVSPMFTIGPHEFVNYALAGGCGSVGVAAGVAGVAVGGVVTV